MNDWTLVGRPGLVIVHMQNAIVKTPSPLEIMGHGKAAREQGVVVNIQRLIAAFRDKHLPVVYCVTYTPRNAISLCTAVSGRVRRKPASITWAPGT